MIELLRIVTAFAGADDPLQRLAFDFGTGTVRRNALAGSEPCAVCGSPCDDVGEPDRDGGPRGW